MKRKAFLMKSDNFLSFDEASKYLSIPLKYLENYVKIGGELKTTKVGRRKMLTKAGIEGWKKQHEFSSCKLSRDDYRRCLEFAIKSFYAYRSTSDFGTSQQRDAGKFVTNFVLGKLGEIATAKFLKSNFDVDTKLDFDLRDAVVGQDITEIAKPRRGGRVYNPLRLRIAIKASKMKNVWLIVSRKEVEDSERASDIYIFARVNLYLNHFIRILKGHKELFNLENIIPDFESINAEVCGFIKKSDLTAHSPVSILPSSDQKIQPSYIVNSGTLNKRREAWSNLIEEL